jgi:hypothetical protein
LEVLYRRRRNQIFSYLPSSAIQINSIVPKKGGRCTHFLKVHVTHTTHTGHATHATHTTHTTHTGHAAHATHATHTTHAARATAEVVLIKGLSAFLLILINPLGKVCLDIRALNLVLRKAGPILALEILFTKT